MTGGQQETVAASEADPRRRVGLIRQILRWWRSRARYQGIRYWLLVQAPILLLCLGALFVINGFVVGWRDAYDVTLQIRSPWETSQPWLAVLLSLAGWLVWPSVTATVVGYVMTEVIYAGQSKPSALIPAGGDLIPLLGGQDVAEDFSRYFEWLHFGDWRNAQSHWEKIVEQFLSTDAVGEKVSPRLAMNQAASAAVSFLIDLPDRRCPLCPPPSAPRGREEPDR
jgi:hypothetical protein